MKKDSFLIKSIYSPPPKKFILPKKFMYITKTTLGCILHRRHLEHGFFRPERLRSKNIEDYREKIW